MKVEKIDHIHVHVKDLDKARRVFGDILGSEFEGVFEGGDQFGVRTAYHRLGLDFLQVAVPGRAKLIENRPEGLVCVSLKVPDIDGATAEMEARGVKMLYKVKIGNVQEVWFEPVMGVQIELVAYPGDDLLEATFG